MEYIEAPRYPAALKRPFTELPALGDDRTALIVHRSPLSYLILNRFPYNPGHLLAVPFREVNDLLDLTSPERADLMEEIVFGQKLLHAVLKPDGINVGFNLGSAAGGSIAHLHGHLVPRWSGDNNFMPVLGQTRILPQALEAMWDRLAADFFNFLHAARGQGLAIRTPDFLRILETFARGEGADLKALYAAPLVIATNRKTIVPKTLGQKLYLQSILKNPVVFGIGPAGTGKTYLAMAAAVSALLKNEVQRIILTRPAVEAGEALGFLPGDLEEKILPYLRPLYDALGDMLDPADVTRLTEKGVIEIAPLAYMRGRTLSNAFVVLDEAQNTTPEQMMMFLTRLGEESRMVVTGDITQIDLPRSKQSGLLEVRRILQNIPGIEFHTFSGSDVVRHPLVLKIIEAYEAYRNPIGTDDGPSEKR